MKNKILTLALILTGLCAPLFAQTGYYTGDAGKGKKVLVYKSTVVNGNSDGTDSYIANIVRKGLVNDLAVYSEMDVIDSSEKENISRIQREYEGVEYDDNNPIEVGKLFQARYCINLTTISTSKSGNKRYSIQATITDIETGKSIGGYTSSSTWDESAYLSNAHKEAANELLPLLGVHLTPEGKRLLLSGSSNSAIISLDMAQQDYDAITARLNAVTKEQSQVSLEKLTAMDAEAKKAQLETTRQLLIQQQKNAEETVNRLKEEEKRKREEEEAKANRNAKAQTWIDKNTKTVEAKAAKIRAQNMKGLTAAQKINVIETEKLTLQESRQAVQNQINAYDELRDAEMKAEIEMRLAQPPRTAEIDASTGELNETGKRILKSDIDKITAKYDKLKNGNTTTILKKTSKSNNSVAKKINSDLNDLEKQTFIVSSLKDDGLYFKVEDYDGDAKGWNYYISFSFNGDTVYTKTGLITYKEMTGKKEPSDSDLLNEAKRNDYYDTVDSYDSFFRMNVPYVQAELYYNIKAADYIYPSLYYIVINKIEFKNVASSSTLKTESIGKSIGYQVYPKVSVDFRTDKQIQEEIDRKNAEEKAKQKAEQTIQQNSVSKNESKYTKEQYEESEKESIQSPRNAWGGLTLIPATWNYYKLPSEYNRHDIQTIGYTLSLGLGNHLFIGGNIEGGDLRGLYDWCHEKNELQFADYLANDTFKDFDGWTWSATFQYGLTYKLAEHLRFNLQGEIGKIFKEKGYGFGGGLDIPFTDHGISATYQYEHTKEFGWINKFSVSIHTLF